MCGIATLSVSVNEAYEQRLGVVYTCCSSERACCRSCGHPVADILLGLSEFCSTDRLVCETQGVVGRRRGSDTASIQLFDAIHVRPKTTSKE